MYANLQYICDCGFIYIFYACKVKKKILLWKFLSYFFLFLQFLFKFFLLLASINNKEHKKIKASKDFNRFTFGYKYLQFSYFLSFLLDCVVVEFFIEETLLLLYLLFWFVVKFKFLGVQNIIIPSIGFVGCIQNKYNINKINISNNKISNRRNMKYLE